jgi:hypothetical protein
VCLLLLGRQSESLSENEEYAAKSLISDPQPAQRLAFFAARHPILHGSLKQPHTTARGQQTHSKQALQRHSVDFSQHLESREEQEKDEEGELALALISL